MVSGYISIPNERKEEFVIATVVMVPAIASGPDDPPVSPPRDITLFFDSNTQFSTDNSPRENFNGTDVAFGASANEDPLTVRDPVTWIASSSTETSHSLIRLSTKNPTRTFWFPLKDELRILTLAGLICRLSSVPPSVAMKGTFSEVELSTPDTTS